MEFALVFPSFILLTMGVIEFGRAMWIQNTLQAAVEQAARCAVVNTTTCGTDIATIVATDTHWVLLPAASREVGVVQRNREIL
jgi:Flp pilus assembly protein TadG